MKKNDFKKIAIIGGGASGLVAGIFALKEGLHVSLFEKNSKLARKILATGNGRCNVTNENIEISRYHGQDREFAKSTLKQFSTLTCKEFFESLGVKLTKKQNGKYFPLSQQATTISEALIYEFKRLGGSIFLDSFVDKITKEGDFFSLHVNNQTKTFNKVLVATGSEAMSKLGSSKSGYGFAKSFGHEITPTFPSLVQLVCKEDNSQVSGVKFEGEASLHVNKNVKISTIGDILLTKYGISGSAILDISREVGFGLLEGKSVEVFVDCVNGFSKQNLSNMLSDFSKKVPHKPLVLLLNGFINKKLALLILERCKISPNKLAKDLTKKDINSILFTLKNLKFTITNTKGFEFAEVVAGGIRTEKIDSKTLESKLVKGLYFSGEVIDIDGDCGGFNLHWAWASGYICGKEMAK